MHAYVCIHTCISTVIYGSTWICLSCLSAKTECNAAWHVTVMHDSALLPQSSKMHWCIVCIHAAYLQGMSAASDLCVVRSLGAHAQTKKAVQEPGSHKDFWMNALGVLAVAVLSILFAKGKLKVRTT